MLEEALELADAMVFGSLGMTRERRSERIREWDEFGAIGELSEGFTIAIGRCDCGRAQRSAVVATLKRQHVLLARVEANQF